MEKEVLIYINGNPISVAKDITILQAAEEMKIKIPTLCFHKDLCIAGNCRVCVVEIEGTERLAPACATPVEQGMNIKTNSLKVRNARRHIIQLLLAEHNSDCTKCYKNGKCELQKLTAEYKIVDQEFTELHKSLAHSLDSNSPSIIKDNSKCIRCQRCVRTCKEFQGVNALSVAYKGHNMRISTFLEKPMIEVVCTFCGQCVNHCPTGALIEKNNIEEVWEALSDPNKHVVVQTAPAIRVVLGEEFGMEPGTRVTGKMVAALKHIGFDSVLDTDFSADLTIVEEGTELLRRLKKVLVDKENSVSIPQITSCSPGWVKYIEHLYPNNLNNLSTCKSPQQMFGALAKTYYANVRKIDPAKIVSVSIMPCTAKKYEANRPEMHSSGYRDVDYVLTTRELAIMIKQAGIDFLSLDDMQHDNLMGSSSGAGAIFGATGGVMEAALRTVYEIVTGRDVPFKNLDILPVRGLEGIRITSIKIEKTKSEWKFLEGIELKCAVAHGLINAKKLMDSIQAGNTNGFHFVEIMACPGGCLGGGGQPIPINPEIRQRRLQAIYDEDASLPIRKSHENPDVKKVYADFLGEPNGEKSHQLLHTHYQKRERF
jgi:NADP-reducing hydrogenase subunit HndD